MASRVRSRIVREPDPTRSTQSYTNQRDLRVSDRSGACMRLRV